MVVILVSIISVMGVKSKLTLYYGKCGCGWLKTDYPFMSCGRCGHIGCGSKEELDRAKKQGTLIDWQKEPPKDIPLDEIRDATTPTYQLYWEEEK